MVNSSDLEDTLINVNSNKVILNLGSGFKKIDGAINIDCYEPAEPDILADIRDIKKHFAENSVDEIHMYHCLEHFVKPDAMQLLTDCYSLLKEDGLLIVELPDLMKCCINLMQAKVNGDEFRIERLGILGIYGEQDGTIEMVHKWGYWPEYLAGIFQEIGFAAVKEELPQTKEFSAKERDFRMVAVK